MAAFVSRSPITYVPGKINVQSSPYFRNLRTNIVPSVVIVNRLAIGVVVASQNENGYESTLGQRKNADALELERLVEDFPSEVFFGDSPFLPRSLSSTSSNSVSDGSRLRVAYQEAGYNA